MPNGDEDKRLCENQASHLQHECTKSLGRQTSRITETLQTWCAKKHSSNPSQPQPSTSCQYLVLKSVIPYMQTSQHDPCMLRISIQPTSISRAPNCQHLVPSTTDPQTPFHNLTPPPFRLPQSPARSASCPSSNLGSSAAANPPSRHWSPAPSGG